MGTQVPIPVAGFSGMPWLGEYCQPGVLAAEEGTTSSLLLPKSVDM
jgi:hypothetical protein